MIGELFNSMADELFDKNDGLKNDAAVPYSLAKAQGGLSMIVSAASAIFSPS
jgi:hypothetical protein